MSLIVDIHHFEGPLDLLLQLIKKNEIRIEDIPIQEITQAYLTVIETDAWIKKEEMGDFLVLASELLYIKSRMLLPLTVEEQEDDDPREALIQRLKAYESYQKLTQVFAELESDGLKFFEKANEDLSFLINEPILISREVTDLFQAMESLLLQRKNRKSSVKKITEMVEREEFEVETYVQKLLRFEWSGEKKLHSFIETNQIGEWIALFIAVLELIKRKWIKASVRKNQIYLTRRDSLQIE